MPPKRKRAEANTAAGESTRQTKKSSKTTLGKNGAADVTEKAGASNPGEECIQSPPKRARTTKKSAAGPRAIDDEPLDSTTSQQESDDELDMPLPKQASSVSLAKAESLQKPPQALFERFADDDNPDVIGPEGVEKLCTEAHIPLDGAQPLILAWQFMAREMAKLSRSEWLQGTEALRISSLSSLALALKELDDLVIQNKEPIASAKKRDDEPYNRTRYRQYALNRDAAFAELYQFCFALSKPSQSRNLDIETAMALWSVSLAPRYPIVIALVEFLNENGSYKGVNKDIWNMVYEFCRTIDKELNNYEADGAWPTMLDDFVAWKKEKMARSAPTDELGQ